MLGIKLIPLEPLLEDSPATRDTAQKLLSAFRNEGFLYLSNYSKAIPPSLVGDVFAQSAHFFDRPLKEKEALEWDSARSNRGYTRQGREKTSQALTRQDVARVRESAGEDIKESFEIGRDDEAGFPNHWPSLGDDGLKASSFQTTMMHFFDCCKTLHRILMRGLAIGMGLDETFFDGFVRNGDNTLRLLHYPEVSRSVFRDGNRVRAGEHTDYGSLTLLFQDESGGLQVERPTEAGGWLDVVPISGTIVVNAGDLLARWSNDLIRSTKHRVIEPAAEPMADSHPARYSVAYFCNPDFDRTIEALPGTSETPQGSSKYASVNSGQYLVQRLTATY